MEPVYAWYYLCCILDTSTTTVSTDIWLRDMAFTFTDSWIEEVEESQSHSVTNCSLPLLISVILSALTKHWTTKLPTNGSDGLSLNVSVFGPVSVELVLT
jgi:hypothetical protein